MGATAEVIIDVPPGQYLYDSIRIVLDAAKVSGQTCVCTFNGCRLAATPESSFQELAEQWERHVAPIRDRQAKEDRVRDAGPELLDALNSVMASLGFREDFQPIGVLPIEVIEKVRAAKRKAGTA